jgi:sulfur-carrier protein adenylyltransferase/sulfurtransferase
MTDLQLTELELRRYSQQIKLKELGAEGQLKLKKASVLVIGAGGMGTPVLQYLAAAGIGTLGICDSDHVNETNFHRQIMYGASDLGKLKTIVAKEKLKLLNPLVDFNIHNILIKQENASFICKEYDIVVDCTNDLSVSEVIHKTCQKSKFPILTGINNGFKGLVIISGEKDTNFSIIKEYKKNEMTVNNGLIGVVSGLIGSIMANLVVKIILHAGNQLSNKLFTFDTLTFKFELQDMI